MPVSSEEIRCLKYFDVLSVDYFWKISVWFNFTIVPRVFFFPGSVLTLLVTSHHIGLSHVLKSPFFSLNILDKLMIWKLLNQGAGHLVSEW